MAKKTKDQYIEESRKLLNPSKEKEINAQKESAEASKKSVKTTYADDITDTTNQYEGMFRKNDVQKEINSRYLERKAAEMGLTDSGLSRMQQTANQLSHANQSAEYSRQRQKAVDTLTAAMNSKLAEIDTTLNTNIANIESSYEKSAVEQGTSNYNSDLDRENELAIEKYKSDNQKEVDLAKAAVNQTKADTANIQAQNQAIKLSNQATEDKAEANTKTFNTLYSTIYKEYQNNNAETKDGEKVIDPTHVDEILAYQIENDLPSNSVQIKRLVNAAGLSMEEYDAQSSILIYDSWSDEEIKSANGGKIPPIKTNAAVSLLSKAENIESKYEDIKAKKSAFDTAKKNATSKKFILPWEYGKLMDDLEEKKNAYVSAVNDFAAYFDEGTNITEILKSDSNLNDAIKTLITSSGLSRYEQLYVARELGITI